MPDQEPDARTIEAISGVNKRGNGFVQIVMEHGPKKERAVLQATTAEARQIATQIMEAAEAAETDAFLFQFLQKQVGANEQTALSILMEYRAWRQSSGGVKSRGADDPHWKDMQKKNEGLDPTKR